MWVYGENLLGQCLISPSTQVNILLTGTGNKCCHIKQPTGSLAKQTKQKCCIQHSQEDIDQYHLVSMLANCNSARNLRRSTSIHNATVFHKIPHNTQGVVHAALCFLDDLYSANGIITQTTSFTYYAPPLIGGGIM